MDIFDDIKSGADGLSEIGIHAGFPNPAAERDHRKPTLSLDRLLIPRPNSTYFFRITGHEWSNQGIYDSDIVVIDRAPHPSARDLVVAWQDDFIIARCSTLPPGVSPWGVVTAVIHQYRASV